MNKPICTVDQHQLKSISIQLPQLAQCGRERTTMYFLGKLLKLQLPCSPPPSSTRSSSPCHLKLQCY